MTRHRLLVYAAVALGCGVFPAASSATLSQDANLTPTPVGYGDDAELNPLWTSDGVLSPGEQVDVNFPLRDTFAPEAYSGTAKGILSAVGTNGIHLTVAPGAGRNFTQTGASTEAEAPYSITVGQNLVCGTRVPLRLSLNGPFDNQTFDYGLPTGAPGAFHRKASTDVGNVIYDGSFKESRVEIDRPAGITKGIRVHIDNLEHRYSTHWLKISLISPSGKEAVLFNQVGNLSTGGLTPTKTFDNITFSEKAVDGQAPVSAEDALDANFEDQVIRPKESFSVFDGEPLTGTWKLKVKDISAPLENRRLPRGGSRAFSYTGKQMAVVGDWQLDTADAVCSANAQPSGPDAWFGGDPLIIDPSGGTLDASASVDTSNGGSIVKWEWDLDGTDANGFEVVNTNGPTTTLAGPLTQGKRTVRLRVTDDSGKVSSIVSREVIISARPVIDGITSSPSQILAGTEVTLDADASDPDLPVGQALTYQWDLDDDGLFDDANGVQVKKTWTESGLQTVRLKVTDPFGAFATKTVLINVSNFPPTAAFTINTNPVIVGQEVTFDGATSTDADGTIVEYSWDLNGDSSFGDYVSDTPTVKYTFEKAGVTTVRLQVTDSTGDTGIVEVPIDVTLRPVPMGTASPDSPLKGETVTFNASGSYDADPAGSIAKYEWDLDGNGSFELSGPALTTAQKSYPNAGVVSVRLRVTDNLGATGLQIIPVTVRNPPVAPLPSTPPVTPTTPQGNGNGNGNGNGTPVEVPKTGPTGQETPAGLDKAVPAIVPEPGQSWTDVEGAGSDGVLPSGFAAKLGMSAKAKAKKVYKKGIAVKLTANDTSTLVLKVMITPKDGKTLGLKLKKATAIGSGKLALKKSGTAKFTVVFAKKYQRYVKKAKKTTVTFQALVTSSEDEEMVLSKKIVLVK